MQGMQPCSGTLQEIVAQGRPCYKARLLHYFTNPKLQQAGARRAASLVRLAHRP